MLVHAVLEGLATINENHWNFVVELPSKFGIGVDVDLPPNEAAAAGEFGQALFDDFTKVASLAGINHDSVRLRHAPEILPRAVTSFQQQNCTFCLCVRSLRTKWHSDITSSNKGYNWQAAFVITGRLGLVWVALRLLFYDSPSTHRALSAEERQDIAAGQEAHLQADGGRPSIGAILAQRNFWGIALPRFLADPTWGTLTNWLPLYLMTVRHFDLKQIALFGWLPFLAADIGCMTGGTISLALQKYGRVSLINARRAAFTIGACTMMTVGFAGFVESPYVAIAALLSVAGFAHQTLSVTAITMASDLFKRSEVATVAGMAGTP